MLKKRRGRCTISPDPKILTFSNKLKLIFLNVSILFQFYDDLYYKYNGRDFCGFYDFLNPGLIIGNLQLVRNVIVKDFDSFANRRVLALGKVKICSFPTSASLQHLFPSPFFISDSLWIYL